MVDPLPPPLDPATLGRVLALCVLLAGAETLHGIARIRWVVPRRGKAWALRWSALSGSVLAWALCAWQLPALGLRGLGAHLGLGAVLAGFMAAFDIALGRWVLRRRWAAIADDFRPASGNHLSWGLLGLVLAPVALGALGGGW